MLYSPDQCIELSLDICSLDIKVVCNLLFIPILVVYIIQLIPFLFVGALPIPYTHDKTIYHVSTASKKKRAAQIND